MIARKQWYQRIQTALLRNRIVTLTGPRQCGKTTLAREFVAEDSVNYFDLARTSHKLPIAEPQYRALPALRLILVLNVL